MSAEEVKQFEERSKAISSHDYEIAVMRDMGELGLGSKLHAKFENGICYDFVEGTILNPKLIRDNPEIVDKLARMVGLLHSYQPPKEIAETKGKNQDAAPKPDEMGKWIKRMLPILKTSKDVRIKEFLDLVGDYEKEAKDIAIDYNKAKRKVVWCHGDLNLSNIIYNAKNGDIKFIDWEMTNYNGREFDIGGLFAQFGGHLKDGYDVSFYPTEETQNRFLRIYLDTYYRNSGEEPTAIDEELEELRQLANRSALAIHLAFSMGMATLASKNEREQVENEVDFVGYALERMRGYREQKPKILAL